MTLTYILFIWLRWRQ